MNDGTMKARKTIYVKANQLSIALAEINVWKRISDYPNCNANIVCYHDYMIQTVGPQFKVYIFMDYIRGENLNVVMNRYISQKLAMDTTTFKVINLQIASALSHMRQQGVAHRDIKATNIISGQNVKVVDMGLSCIIKQYAKEQSIEFAGWMWENHYDFGSFNGKEMIELHDQFNQCTLKLK